jgi:hypothetical protein
MQGAASGVGVAGSSFVTSPLHFSSYPTQRFIVLTTGFTHYNYPGIYQYQDFHHCGLEPNDNIVDYNNAVEVWTCQLDGLAEYASSLAFDAIHLFRCFLPCDSLATETEYVRQRLAAYANDLISLGVDGLRLDASKRTLLNSMRIEVANSWVISLDINPDDIANILSRLTTRPYITQEV